MKTLLKHVATVLLTIIVVPPLLICLVVVKLAEWVDDEPVELRD